MYTFKTELFGLTVEVEGTFEAGEAPSIDCPGCEPEFIIEDIQHKGESLEVDSLPDEVLEAIVKEAFEKYDDDYDPS